MTCGTVTCFSSELSGCILIIYYLEKFICPVSHMFWNNMQEHVVSLQIVAKFKYE